MDLQTWYLGLQTLFPRLCLTLKVTQKSLCKTTSSVSWGGKCGHHDLGRLPNFSALECKAMHSKVKWVRAPHRLLWSARPWRICGGWRSSLWISVLIILLKCRNAGFPSVSADGNLDKRNSLWKQCFFRGLPWPAEGAPWAALLCYEYLWYYTVSIPNVGFN